MWTCSRRLATTAGRGPRLLATVGRGCRARADNERRSGRGRDDKACRVRNASSGQTYTRLQAAVNAARRGDRLVVRGTCVGHTAIGKRLTIVGRRTTRSGGPQLTGRNKDRVLTIAKGARVTLRDLVVTRGDSKWGGGIQNNGDLVLTNVTVRRNRCHLKDVALGKSGRHPQPRQALAQRLEPGPAQLVRCGNRGRVECEVGHSRAQRLERRSPSTAASMAMALTTPEFDHERQELPSRTTPRVRAPVGSGTRVASSCVIRAPSRATAAGIRTTAAPVGCGTGRRARS